MLLKRVIVCLDVADGRVVKGVSFEGLRDVGDPVELAARYEAEGADEIVFLDISATLEGRRTLLDVVARTARNLFVPLTVGGGIRTADDVARTLHAGADKVAVNSALVERPELLKEGAGRFGSQCLVASIDARSENGAGDGYRVYIHGGRTPTALEAVEWAKDCVRLGAGEILLTSIDRDGQRNGFDLELTRRVAAAVSVPVVASGGAGTAAHFREAFAVPGVDAALAAGIFHDGVTTVTDVKHELLRSDLPIRPPRTSPAITGSSQ